MTRYIRWSLILGMTILIFIAGAAQYWVPWVVSEENIAQQADVFPCPPTFEAEVCTLLEKMDEENPLESAAMLEALQNDPVPGPSDEKDPASVENDIDKETVSAFSNTLIRTGRFTEIDRLHKATGTVNISELVADGVSSRYLRFEDEFNVERGPKDLSIYLSVNPEPRTAEEMFANDTAIKIGLLKGNFGGQNYRLPDDIDVTQYRSVVIFSPEFERIFSTATLEQPL